MTFARACWDFLWLIIGVVIYAVLVGLWPR